MAKKLKNSTEYINFKVPAEMKAELLKKHKQPGELSIAMRALVQMYLRGNLPPLEYVQSIKDNVNVRTNGNTTSTGSGGTVLGGTNPGTY